MKNITIQLFEFSELSSKAKQKALEGSRDINVDNPYWYECIYEHFSDLCQSIGIEISENGISFQGFSSQGDGSAFEGKVDVPALLAAVNAQVWKQQFPFIELRLEACTIDRRIISLMEKGIIECNTKVRQNGNRCYTVWVDKEFNYRYGSPDNYPNVDSQLLLLEQWLERTADILNRYLYKSLQQEYDYLISDAAVQETIEMNGYHFTVFGDMAQDLAALATLSNQ